MNRSQCRHAEAMVQQLRASGEYQELEESYERQAEQQIAEGRIDTPSPFTVDASAALKKLGIDHPVEFLNADLNHGNPRGRWARGYGVTNASTIPPGNVILLDWAAILWSQKQYADGELPDDVPDPRMVSDPATIIAHELWHVKQDLGLDLVHAQAEYVAAGEDYETNSWELDAMKHSIALAPLVKLIPNK